MKIERVVRANERDQKYGVVCTFDLLLEDGGEAVARVRDCSLTQKDGKTYVNPPRRFRGRLDGRAQWWEPVWLIGAEFKDVIAAEVLAALGS